MYLAMKLHYDPECFDLKCCIFIRGYLKNVFPILLKVIYIPVRYFLSALHLHIISIYILLWSKINTINLIGM
jgi:hypothetical protein